MIFFIFLYQKYIYRVDPKRVNEFGVSKEMLEENGTANAIEGKPEENGDNSAIESNKGDSSSSDSGKLPDDGPSEPKSSKEKKND